MDLSILISQTFGATDKLFARHSMEEDALKELEQESLKADIPWKDLLAEFRHWLIDNWPLNENTMDDYGKHLYDEMLKIEKWGKRYRRLHGEA